VKLLPVGILTVILVQCVDAPLVVEGTLCPALLGDQCQVKVRRWPNNVQHRALLLGSDVVDVANRTLVQNYGTALTASTSSGDNRAAPCRSEMSQGTDNTHFTDFSGIKYAWGLNGHRPRSVTANPCVHFATHCQTSCAVNAPCRTHDIECRYDVLDITGRIARPCIVTHGLTASAASRSSLAPTSQGTGGITLLLPRGIDAGQLVGRLCMT
jgi:hypothetical protein